MKQSELLHSYPTLSLTEYYSRVTEYTLNRKYTMKGHKPSCSCHILQVSPRERRAAQEKSQWHKTRRLRHSAVSAVPVPEHGWQSQPWLLTLGQHVVYLSSSTKEFSSRTRSLSCWRQVLNAAPIRPWIKRTSALMGWLRGKRVLKRSRVNALLLWQAPRHSLEGLGRLSDTEETESGQTLSAWAAEESWDVTKTALIAPSVERGI